MSNEFVKVHNEPSEILLCAWMQRMQQQEDAAAIRSWNSSDFLTVLYGKCNDLC